MQNKVTRMLVSFLCLWFIVDNNFGASKALAVNKWDDEEKVIIHVL